MAEKELSRFFVLDTNILMHDPASLFRFQEHDIFIPMVVLEELDAGKKVLPKLFETYDRLAVLLMTLLIPQEQMIL